MSRNCRYATRAGNTTTVGHRAERRAEAFLKRRGLKTVIRNYACKLGEIDLIALDGATLAFVEVRFRRSSSHGSAAASVTATKQRRIARTAAHFLLTHPEWSRFPTRFDVVALTQPNYRVQIEWIRNAFSL